MNDRAICNGFCRLILVTCLACIYGGRHRKSCTGPNPNFGRRPKIYKQGFVRDLSEESWRPGLLVPTSDNSGAHLTGKARGPDFGIIGYCISCLHRRVHQKSWTGPKPNFSFGRQPQIYTQGIIRDLSEESWRPGHLAP